MLKLALRFFVVAILFIGMGALFFLIQETDQLEQEVEQLEAELGRMNIEDRDRVHLVEIESPEVPPEIAGHISRIWQFRCYLPPNYDYKRLRGGGRVMEHGLYMQGGFSSGWSSPIPESSHKLLTISLREDGDQVQCFTALGSSSSTTSWSQVTQGSLKSGKLVTQTLVTADQGTRSFDNETILPLIKLFDPDTAKEETIQGRSETTYAGGLVVLFPKSKETLFKKLRDGQIPDESENAWIAEPTER